MGCEPGTSEPSEEVTDADDDFVALYQRSYSSMVRLATLLVDQVDVAEEVVQDAFLAVYRRWSSTDDPGAYVRTCVVNRCRDVQRRRRLRRQRIHLGSVDPTVHEPELLRDAIGALPTNQRVTLVLRFYEDLSIPQIAEVMGTRQGTVKSWLHRALSQLRGVIER